MNEPAPLTPRGFRSGMIRVRLLRDVSSFRLKMMDNVRDFALISVAVKAIPGFLLMTLLS